MLKDQFQGDMITPEHREQLIAQNAAWLGGIFDTAGTITITGGRSVSPTPHITPDIGLVDNSYDRLSVFHQITGFPITSATPNSWIVQTQGRRAASFVETIEPYTPSRQQIIAAIKELPHLTPDQQLQVARSVPYMDRFQNLTPDHYSDFTANPAQVAGVLDARGVFMATEKPYMELFSRNIPLFEALQKEFKGSLEYTQEGEIEMAHGKMYVVKHPKVQWRIKASQAKELINFALPFIQMRRNEAHELLQKGRS